MDFAAFEKIILGLATDITAARERGDKYIPSIATSDVLIFDVSQDGNLARDKSWGDLSERQQIETTFSALPDYIMRDRICVPPRYLNMHIYAATLALWEFRERLRRASTMEGVRQVHPEQNFLARSHDLFQGITRWAHENHMPRVFSGERVLVNIPVSLVSGGWFFIKLMANDEIAPAHLAFTFEPEEYTFTFEIVLRLAGIFAQS